MADERKIVIEVQLNDKSQDAVSNVVDNEKDETAKIEKNSLAKNVLVNQAFQIAKQNITKSVDIMINRGLTLREDYIGEQTYQNAKTVINKVTSFGTSIWGGAMLGSSLGPVGTIAGAVIGAVGWGISEMIAQDERKFAYNSSLNASRYNMLFSQERAGLINGGRGTRE